MIKIMKSPWTMMAGILAGLLLGTARHPAVPYLQLFGWLYVSMLQICVLPIVACSVCIGCGRLFSATGRGIAIRSVAAMAAALLAAAVIGTAGGMLLHGYLRPGVAGKQALAQLSGTARANIWSQFQRIEYYQGHMGEAERAVGAGAEAERAAGTEAERAAGVGLGFRPPWIGMIFQLFPDNLFKALAADRSAPVFLFFALLGIMLGNVQMQKREAFLNAMEGIFAALCNLIHWLMVLLPLAICALLAEQYAAAGTTDMAEPVLRLATGMVLTMSAMVSLTAVVVQCVSGCTWRQHWRAVKRVVFIALGTKNAIAGLPAALEDCQRELGMDPKITGSVLPVAMVLCQSGGIVCGAVTAVFAAAVYDVPLNGHTILVIAAGSILYGLSAIGMPGALAASMLTMVLVPLGIPARFIVLAYLAAMPAFEPLQVFSGVYSSFAVVCLVAGKKQKRQKPIRGRRYVAERVADGE